MVSILGYISEKEFETLMTEIKEDNLSKERKRKLKEEKNKYKFKFKMPSTSKLVLIAVFMLCIEIIIFSEYAMIATGDASAMYVLIGVPATLVPTLLGYFNKSKKENSTGGIVYEKTMHELNQTNDYIEEYEEELSDDEAMG